MPTLNEQNEQYCFQKTKLVTPENKSNITITGTKYLAFTGTGINIIINSAFGNIKSKSH